MWRSESLTACRRCWAGRRSEGTSRTACRAHTPWVMLVSVFGGPFAHNTGAAFPLAPGAHADHAATTEKRPSTGKTGRLTATGTCELATAYEPGRGHQY